ncbi:MAG: HD-GYP domain-containing protein [Lachnospiraceae bacterium]|nr:HD-GYP domain-containing protein [Lachnospiraceae bacterium]
MSFVMFVYIIFSVVVVLVDGHSLEIPKETGFVFGILYNLSNIINVVVVCLIYLLIISALSKLSGKKRQVNWKLFLIPPSVFISFYSVLDFYTSEFSSIDANLVVSVLSYVILILFIWAFYIIINNIKATDDAIMAKNDIQTLSVEVMEALAHTIDAKDEYTRGHSIRVARYSRMIASKMGLSSEQSENIYYMGLLHDIGKIGVPNEIINKPGKLTDEEFGQIRKHPVTGFDILAEIKSRPSLSIGARWHHERVDGKGYPDHKSGEEIPIEARIIAVADSYDAMTSNRSYRQYLPQDVVRSEIENNIGSQFDEMAAKCMLQIIDEDTEYVLHE